MYTYLHVSIYIYIDHKFSCAVHMNVTVDAWSDCVYVYLQLCGRHDVEEL